MNSETKLFNLFWVLGTIGLIILAIFTNGTGGGGDSVLHYLYAKYVPQNPENLFNHWAKPFFTLLAFPFTYFGFNGIKLFNVICSSASVWFSFKILELWNIKNRWAIAPILFSITLFVSVSLSGLTEPLSALILTSSVFFIANKKLKTGLKVVSFMPFIRSEGLVILCVFIFYLIIKRYYKYIPLLLTGHLVYAIAGYPYYQDILWIFTKIPYANQSSSYGRGNWGHFFIQLNFQAGPIVYILFWIGSLYNLLTATIFKTKLSTESGFFDKFWLIYGCFFAFFFAHATFWALGIFNSMGLVRVFVSVMPLMAIISIDGINFIDNTLYNLKYNYLNKFFVPAVILAIAIIPFTKGKYQHKIPDQFVLSRSQTSIRYEMKNYLSKSWPKHTIIYSDPNIPYMLDLNPFNGKYCQWSNILQSTANLKNDMILVADIWFSEVEWRHSIESLKKDSSLQLQKTFPSINPIFYVFSKK